MNIPKAIIERAEEYSAKLTEYPKLSRMYKNCYLSTIKTAMEKCDDGTYFVVTGDIEAMWLRDSSAQIAHYIPLANDKEVAEIIEGVIKRQFMYIKQDPYANAFNKENNDNGHITDIPRKIPIVFERKYEVDSLCYPLRTLYLYWKTTKNEKLIQDSLEEIAEIILKQWKVEQYHFEKSPYRFTRTTPCAYHDTIHNNGMGNKVVYTGMTWSGFRPSDDACEYGYLTASQMFAVVVLDYMSEMLEKVCDNTGLAQECIKLKKEINDGIKKYAITEHPKYGKIFVCETDGMGNFSMMDDANIPSLLSAPYIGYLSCNDEIYKNTRNFLLSSDNRYYFHGKYAHGIGSRHTPGNYIWHMALVMQGLTSSSDTEQRKLIKMIVNTDADKEVLHESFNADNPYKYTREWFTWPNSLFAEFIEKCVDNGIIIPG